MEFTNEFAIPLGIDEALAVLTDLERVAPCMPGATLEEVEGDEYRGRMKVKVGPMSLTYRGTARLVQSDPQTYTARIEASGQETRGSGTAAATVTSTLVDKGGETLVTVVTDINVTGRPAQFGRGVMADVGAKIIDKFAACLADELAARTEPEPAADVGTEVTADEPGGAPLPQTPSFQPPREEALDLFEVAGGATAKRVLPVAAAVAVVLLLVRWLRRR